MSKLAKYLNQHIIGNVFDRLNILDTYSTDRSILKIQPKLVALPKTTDDIQKLIRFSNQLALRGLRLPVTVRGTGRDKTGAAIGDGMIISTERLNHIEEIDLRGRLIRVQPGLTLGELNTALGMQGLCLPIDYDSRTTIGGLIANCPNDDASARHGGIYHYVERIEVVLSSGDLVQLGPIGSHALSQKISETSFEGKVYRRIDELLDEYADTVIDRGMQRFSGAGYANITRVRNAHHFNLMPLFFSAQGTLGIITDIILRVEVLPPPTRRLALTLRDTKTLLRFLNFVSDLDPRTLKVFDLRIIKETTTHGKQPDLLPRELGEGWLVLASFDDRKLKSSKKIQHCLEVLPVGTFVAEETVDNTVAFQEFDSTILSYLNASNDGERSPIIDDVYIPRYRFEEFVEKLEMVSETLDLKLALFGSYATSNYHVRPLVDCTSMDGRKQIISFMQQYSQLVKDCEGLLTGGTPEGRIKALPIMQNFSEEEKKLYQEIKDAFDPHHILNPNIKLGAELTNTIRHLRTEPKSGIIRS